MAKGIIKRYAFRKGFGFIVDDKSGDELFFHKSEWQGDGPIRQGIEVKFVAKESEKGFQAESVSPLNKAANKKKPAEKKLSIEERVSSLEAAVTVWKVVSILSFVGFVLVAVNIFI